MVKQLLIIPGFAWAIKEWAFQLQESPGRASARSKQSKEERNNIKFD